MTEQSIAIGLTLSALAGAATPIGGLIAVMATRRAQAGLWSFGLGVSAGTMVFLSIFDLLPEAFEIVTVSNGRMLVPAGLAEPLGGLIALLFLGPYITPNLLGCLFAAVAGIMVYVAVDELIPAGQRLGRSHLHLTGFAVGVLLMWIAMGLIKFL